MFNKLNIAIARLPRKAVLVAIALMCVFSISAVALAGFGPDRETKVYLGPGTSGFDHVTFNSFTGVPSYGDERDFLRAKQDGADNSTMGDPIVVKNGDVVKVYMRVHNNADPSLNDGGTGIGVAEDLKVRVSLPGVYGKVQNITGFISASNADPTNYFDTTTFKSAKNVKLSYVAGSAKITTNTLSNVALNDEIADSGVLVGDDALDGKMQGCFEYLAWVTFQVKVKEAPVTPPTPELPKTGAGDAFAIVLGTSVLFVATRNWLKSRQDLQKV